ACHAVRLGMGVWWYGLLLVIAGTGAVGDIALYRWATAQQRTWLFGVGLAMWLTSVTVYALLLRWSALSLSVSFILVAVFHIAAVLGWDRFGEGSHLSRLEIIGIVLAVIGVLLIEWGYNTKAAAH